MELLEILLAENMLTILFCNGARAAGMTGSGPAIVIFIPSLVRSATEKMIKIFSNKPDIEEVVEVKLLRSETTDSEN